MCFLCISGTKPSNGWQKDYGTTFQTIINSTGSNSTQYFTSKLQYFDALAEGYTEVADSVKEPSHPTNKVETSFVSFDGATSEAGGLPSTAHELPFPEFTAEPSEDGYFFDAYEEDWGDVEVPAEQKLMYKLLKHYEKSVRPVRNASETVVVKMGLTMTQIFDMVRGLLFSC